MPTPYVANESEAMPINIQYAIVGKF